MKSQVATFEVVGLAISGGKKAQQPLLLG